MCVLLRGIYENPLNTKMPRSNNQRYHLRGTVMKFGKVMLISILAIGIVLRPLIVKASEINEIRQVEQEAEEQEAEEQETEEQPEPDTEIVFDADAAVNKTAAKSALADMHGVFVFRDAFITQEKLVKQAEKDEREQIEKKVLTNTQPEASYKEWAQLVFQADIDRYVKDVYYDKEGSDLFLWIYCGIVSICILCAAIMIEDYLRKKKRSVQKDSL